MPKFRKKPVVIEAVHYIDGQTSLREVAEFLGAWPEVRTTEECDTFVLIPTLEGVMEASPGDYIIRGVKGEFYPCKPDIFDATYEPVSE